MIEDKEIHVIGCGVIGLTTAFLLQQNKYKVCFVSILSKPIAKVTIISKSAISESITSHEAAAHWYSTTSDPFVRGTSHL